MGIKKALILITAIILISNSNAKASSNFAPLSFEDWLNVDPSQIMLTGKSVDAYGVYTKSNINSFFFRAGLYFLTIFVGSLDWEKLSGLYLQ